MPNGQRTCKLIFDMISNTNRILSLLVNQDQKKGKGY